MLTNTADLIYINACYLELHSLVFPEIPELNHVLANALTVISRRVSKTDKTLALCQNETTDIAQNVFV